MEVATRNLVHAVDVFGVDDEGGELVWRWGASGDGPTADVADHAVQEAVARGFPSIAAWDPNQAALAWPCVRDGQLRGVVRFGCSGQDELRGAFEVWRRNERGELGLDDHWYANLDRLEQVTRFIKFPRRAGLPGRIWEDRFPRVLGALGDSKEFVRVAVARAERLSAAVGVPFMGKPPELDAVLLLLSTGATPIARAMEVWAREPESEQLKIVSADYGPLVDLGPVSRRLRLRIGEGIAGRVYDEAAPWLTRDVLGVEFPRGDRFAEYGVEIGVGIPVFIGGDLVACVNLYL